MCALLNGFASHIVAYCFCHNPPLELAAMESKTEVENDSLTAVRREGIKRWNKMSRPQFASVAEQNSKTAKNTFATFATENSNRRKMITMEERFTGNEPTTGEIVRALRCVAEATKCKDCRYKYPVGNVILCDHEQMNGNAADRLESQERTIAEMDAYIELLKEREGALENDAINFEMNLSEMTARAESAERERDAAVNDLMFFGKNVHTCRAGKVCNMAEIDHSVCIDCKMWTWRGQPQDGGGK